MPNQFDQVTADDLDKLTAQLTSGSFYMRADDNLKVTSWGALAGVTLAIRSRMLTLDGTVVASADTHTPASNRTAVSTTIPTAEGWLLGCEVFATGGTPITGQVFVIVEVVRGLASSSLPLQTLLQGYVSAARRLSYPGSAIVDSTEGQGVIRSITATVPAAGVEISETVPTGARWRLLSLSARLVTSATVINRTPLLLVDDGTNTLWRATSGITAAAGTTTDFSFAAGQGYRDSNAGSFASAGIGDQLDMAAGFRLRTTTVNIQVADQFSAIQYLVREWLEPTS